ncbi:copper resistance protein CopC [Aquibacillus albus]|uniref:Copper transport protein n=1 Tax=Aquibacillus albus TaxID=1168171 RepID=A0ABS2MXG4_9BACI|nr:copper resistance protein CopC [Aquibacillus albus]MBM7570554.1 copper transport protein [Aquibacillus albus]
MFYIIQRISLLLIIAVATNFTMFSTLAEAHSSLKETYPEGNAVLEKSPSEIQVWFQDPVVIHGDSIKVMDSKGKEIPTRKSELDPEDKRHIVTKLEEELEAGKYKVKINVIAQDGFVVEEAFTFSVDGEKKESEYKQLELVESNVSDGKIYNEAPNQIDLGFNQPAEITAFGIFDDNYQPIATEQAKINEENPNHIKVPVKEKLDPGTYQITWYASPINKEDSPVQRDRVGVFYFAVDEFSSMRPVGDTQNTIDTDTFSFSFGLKQMAYWLTFIGLTVLFGLAWFDTVIYKNIRRVKIDRLFYLLSVIGIILLILHHRLDLSGLHLKDFFAIKFVWIPILQIILITLGICLRTLRVVMIGLALLLWPFMIGHASYPRYGGYVTMTVNVIHILAAGIWMGGLVALLLKPKHQDSQEWFKKVGPSFSKWAVTSVILIIFSGVWMSAKFLPSFSWISLMESEWGRALIIKVTLFLVLLMIGYIQRKIVKQMKRKIIHSFFKRVRTEIIYGVLVFFFAASLVAANPSAAEQGVYEEPVERQDDLELNVEIAPLEMGLNTITLDFANNPDIKNVAVELSMPPNWRIKVNAFKVDEGLYKLTGNLLHAAGTINMKVNVTLDNGKVIEIPYRIVVPGEIRFNE